MSIATTRKQAPVQRDKISRAGAQVIVKTAKQIRQDLFGALALFAVATTGIGSLIGQKFNAFWYILTLLLVGIAFGKEFFIFRSVNKGEETPKYDHSNHPT